MNKKSLLKTSLPVELAKKTIGIHLITHKREGLNKNLIRIFQLEGEGVSEG